MELQREILLDFHHDLTTNSERLVAREGTPLSPQFCAYLNASSYIATISRAWGNMKVRNIYLYGHVLIGPSPTSSLSPSITTPKTTHPPPYNVLTLTRSWNYADKTRSLLNWKATCSLPSLHNSRPSAPPFKTRWYSAWWPGSELAAGVIARKTGSSMIQSQIHCRRRYLPHSRLCSPHCTNSWPFSETKWH